MTKNNLLKWRMAFKLSATFMLALFVFTSCKKKDTSLGMSTIDQNELLNASQIDTFSINTYSELEDSIITSNPAYVLLGSYNDPKFGTNEASFYTQVRLAASKPVFGDLNTIIIDSFVLGLQYADYYGDFSSQKVEVYELNESIYKDSTYYASTTKTCFSDDLTDPNHTIEINPIDKIVIGTDTVASQMRIYLDTNLARTLMEEAGSGTATFDSNDNFLNYFKGLQVKVNNSYQAPGVGGIFSFDIISSQSKLTIYYRLAGVKKTYDFMLNTSCASFNSVTIDNAGKPVQNVIDNHELGKNQFYAQALKSRAVISLPGIDDLPKKSIIHEAKLYLPVEYQTGYKYDPGLQISVSTRLDDGTTDLYSIGTATYDEFSKQYVVDLRSYVQAISSGQRFPVTVSGTTVYALIKGTDIYVNPRLFNTSATRIIFNGVNTNNKNKPKLILKYTEF